MAEADKERCRVMVFDDESAKVQRLCAQLRKLALPGLEVEAPSLADAGTLLDTLYSRRKALDEGKSCWEIASPFDDIDVLLVDFDLRDLEQKRGSATGEEIAYVARLFSKVKIIVVLNHPNIGVNNFDLTLQRDREFRADFYLGFDQASNPGLWCSRAGHRGFLPWGWIPLMQEALAFSRCVEQVKQHLDAKVLHFFGLNSDDTQPSAQMLEYLGIKPGSDIAIREILRPKSAGYVREKDCTSPDRFDSICSCRFRIAPKVVSVLDRPVTDVACRSSACGTRLALGSK